MTAIELGVAEAYPNDCGRGIARLDPEILQRLGVGVGDVVEIKGGDRTVAKVMRADKQDWDTNTVRIDWITRKNAGVGVADTVTIRSSGLREADSVVLDRPEELTAAIDPEDVHLIKRQLIARSLVESDIVPVMRSSEHPFCSPTDTIQFRTVKTKPNGPVIVTAETSVRLSGVP